jgi:hypothetical protein
MSDDSNVLIGAEQKVTISVEDNNLMAIAMRDIFDKKVVQVWLSRGLLANSKQLVAQLSMLVCM